MSRIHKIDFMALPKHIDLDKVVAISDAYFIDRMGHGGWFVAFSIDVQLRDEPLRFERELKDDVESRYFMTVGHRLAMLDGTFINNYHGKENQILAVWNLQHDIDGLIQEWKK